MQGWIPSHFEMIECTFVMLFRKIMWRDDVQRENFLIEIIGNEFLLTTNSTWKIRWLFIIEKIPWMKNLPTTTSRTFFQFNSVFVPSWQMVSPIRRWIPWWRINRSEERVSSECSTVTGTYLNQSVEQEIREGESTTYSPDGDNSKISYQTRRSWVRWTWLVSMGSFGCNVWAGNGLENGYITVGERVLFVLKCLP